MLKARAVERFLGQVVEPQNDGISGAMLFNRDGMTLAKFGKSLENGNVYSALLSNIWETFEQQGIRDELNEMTICCEDGIVSVLRVSTLLLAIVSNNTIPLGQIKAKLHGLAEHLKCPLAAVI